jgi:hypothetical protein
MFAWTVFPLLESGKLPENGDWSQVTLQLSVNPLKTFTSSKFCSFPSICVIIL